MEKLDLFKELKAEYNKSKKPNIIETTSANYLTVTGIGAPAGEEYTAKVSALYAVAFPLKMNSKKHDKDYVVSKMEGLWWADEASEWDFLDVPRERWQWKMIIRTPDFISQPDVDSIIEMQIKKKKELPIAEVTYEEINEGLCVQALHVGPYADETPLIRSMHELATDEGYEFHGLHHEIYLSDPRKVDPSKLKTILRHPIRIK